MAPQETEAPATGSESGAGERLESWKEIAAYLGRGVTTVQRWELEEGLPVHRLPHAKRGSVFAFKPELDSWRVNRVRAAATCTETPTSVQSTRGPWLWLGRGPRSVAWIGVGVVGLALFMVSAWRGVGRTEPRKGNEGSALTLVPRPLANDSAPEHGPNRRPRLSRSRRRGPPLTRSQALA